ncbi:MAG TPA: hypothetical protein VEU73_08690 [Gemmatimonadales bacterium]|nr:hypothetical protein [Gemmatimonadales bacterium]
MRLKLTGLAAGIGLLGCGRAIREPTASEHHVSLAALASSAEVIYDNDRIEYTLDRDTFFRFLEEQRPNRADFRPPELRKMSMEKARALDELEGDVTQEIAATGHYRLDRGLRSPTTSDREPHILANLLERGLGTLLDRRTNRLVTQITVRHIGEHCGPRCEHGREFLLPDGTVFLSVVDWWS